MDNFIITIDTDWAPDEIISQIADELIKAKVKATWFITNDSQEVQRLKNYPNLFELGLHPNFSEESTQGSDPREIMKSLLKIVPNAKFLRSHSLVQSSSLLKIIREEFNILYDVSLLMPHTADLRPHQVFFSKNKGLIRLPYFWEDDEELNRPTPILTIKHPYYHQPGLKIFNFHPIHIVLNSGSLDNYEKMKADLNYPKVSLRELNSYVFEGRGIGTFFQELVKEFSKGKLFNQTMSGLVVKLEKEK